MRSPGAYQSSSQGIICRACLAKWKNRSAAPARKQEQECSVRQLIAKSEESKGDSLNWAPSTLIHGQGKMAEVIAAADAPSTAPDVVPEEDQKGASKGERTERVKRLDRPNRAALEEEVAKLNQTVEQHQARIQEIKVLIDNKKAGRQGVSGEVAEARNKLNELVNHYKALIEEKNSIKEELKYIDQAREKAREEAKSLKSKLPYVRSAALLLFFKL